MFKLKKLIKKFLGDESQEFNPPEELKASPLQDIGYAELVDFMGTTNITAIRKPVVEMTIEQQLQRDTASRQLYQVFSPQKGTIQISNFTEWI